MNRLNTLFSLKFWSDLWSKTERCLRVSCDNEILFYSTPRDDVDEYWTVRFLPIRPDVFVANRAEIESATCERKEVLCMVAHHDDKTLAALIGPSEPHWIALLIVMVDRRIRYTRSVFRMGHEYLAPNRFARLYQVSNPQRYPKSTDEIRAIEREMQQPLTSIYVRAGRVAPDLLCDGWQLSDEVVQQSTCESTESFMRGVLGLLGPSSSSAEQTAKIAHLGTVYCSRPDQLPPVPMLKLRWRDYNARFRWPFLLESLLQFCLVYPLPPTIVEAIFEARGQFPEHREPTARAVRSICGSIVGLKSQRDEANKRRR